MPVPRTDFSTKKEKQITTVIKNMKAKAMPLWNIAMLSKRFIIESINNHLKNMNGLMVNLLTGLVTYCLEENKPRLYLTRVEHKSMVIA